jgi:2-succinyl-6-hydroxy-2,4-cyclohexadiene-1-carboxylate synthase
MKDGRRRRGASAVVFVPGFMQRGDAWSPVAELVEERYRSICLDPSGVTLEERLAEIRDLAPTGSALVGYSMGGRLALHVVLHNPGRYGALVTVGSTAGIEDPGERAARRVADAEFAAWIERSPIEAVVERWEGQPPLATQAGELRAAQRPGRLSHDPAQLASLLRTAGQGAMAPLWDRLHEIACPTLCLAGEHDERYVGAARRMAALVAGGRCALVPGAGHAAQLEAPERVAAYLLDFLDEHLG